MTWFKLLISSTLVKESFIYTLFNIINKAVPFLLLPILVKYLGAEGYGLYSIFIALTMFIKHFAGLNLQSVIHRRFFDKNEIDFPSYNYNSLLLVFFSSILIFVMVYLYGYFVGGVVSIPPVVLLWVVFIAMTTNVINIQLNICRAENKPILYGAIVISKNIVILTVTIFLLAYCDFDWRATVWGQVIGCVIFCVLALIFFYRNNYIKAVVNYTYLKDALKYVLPLIPHGISGATFNLSGRFFVASIEGLEQTGYYTIAYQIASLISLVCTAFSIAWTNWMFANLKAGGKNQQKVVKATYIYIGLVVCIGCMYMLIWPFLAGFMFGDEYIENLGVTNWIVAGFMLQGFYQVIVGYLFYGGNTAIISKVTVSVAIISLGTNYILISAYGAVGAGISFFVSWLLMFVLIAIRVRSYFFR